MSATALYTAPPALSILGASTRAEREESALDYWEELAAEDGAIWFYNHTTQAYHASLPTNVENSEPSIDCAQIKETDTELYPEVEAGMDVEPYIAEVDAMLSQDVFDENKQSGGRAEIWTGGAEGEVFVAWPLDDPGDMKATPTAGTIAGKLPEVCQRWSSSFFHAPFMFPP